FRRVLFRSRRSAAASAPRARPSTRSSRPARSPPETTRPRARSCPPGRATTSSTRQGVEDPPPLLLVDVERRDLGFQMGEQHVEIADEPEHAAEELQLAAQSPQ